MMLWDNWNLFRFSLDVTKTLMEILIKYAKKESKWKTSSSQHACNKQNQ